MKKWFSLIVLLCLLSVTFAQDTVLIKDPSESNYSKVNQDGLIGVSEGGGYLPEPNFFRVDSSGTTSRTLVSAATGYSIVVQFISVLNRDTSAGHQIRLCNGPCVANNYILIPAPIADTSSNAGAVPTAINMSLTRNTALHFRCVGACSTNVTVSGTYKLLKR